MKIVLIVMSFLLIHQHALLAQELPSSTEAQFESLVEAEKVDADDDSYMQDLETFRKHPININTADAGLLENLKMLSDLQISQLQLYRKHLGKLSSIYELQAIPYWDIGTIKKILPYIFIGEVMAVAEKFSERLRQGEHSFIFRATQTLEPSKGYQHPDSLNHYEGSPQHLFARYRYNHRNLLQWGLTADKDAGEPMSGKEFKGFDFYSIHFFARKLGLVESLAIGDYTIQLGQGLLSWQGMAFNKSADLASIKRQSQVLRPYTGGGEYLFNRGAGIGLQKKHVRLTVFVSSRKLSTTVSEDTTGKAVGIETIQFSGYHRTSTELRQRNNARLQRTGFNWSWVSAGWNIGLSSEIYRYSLPLVAAADVYAQYDFIGLKGRNHSVDYSFTYRNMQFFGEMALNAEMKKANVAGILLSVDPAVDLSLMYRRIERGYTSLEANAFTEFSGSGGERGVFAAIAIRPAGGWRVDAYADFFQSDWLRYRVNAPSKGSDFLCSVNWKPDKISELSLRFKQETKPRNNEGPAGVIAVPVPQGRQSWRFQCNIKVDNSLQWRNRVEYVRHMDGVGGTGQGFLQFTDLVYKPMLLKYSLVGRLAYFNSDDYDSRLYAYENDVLYKYAVPAFSGKGWRYYIICDWQISKKLTVCVRWARTKFIERESVGSGLDEVGGSKRTECTFQIRLTL